MLDAIRALIRQLICKHHWVLISVIYGDHINHYNARTFWRCGKCDRGAFSTGFGPPPGEKP